MSKVETNTIDTVSGSSTMQIGSTNTATINLGVSGDTVNIPSGVTLANAGTATGFGITGWSSSSGSLLPASASAGIYLGVNSATASNLLHDYEEGDWTPTFITSGGNLSPQGSVTPASVTGKYVKVGDVVTVQFQTGLFSVTGTSGSYQITNMPFTAQANVSSVGTIREYGQTGYLGYSYLSGGGNTLVLYGNTTGGQVNNPYFYGTITYRVN